MALCIDVKKKKVVVTSPDFVHPEIDGIPLVLALPTPCHGHKRVAIPCNPSPLQTTDPVAKALKAEASVVDKDVLYALVHPAPVLVLQRLRQVPVVQRDHGLDVVGQQLVDEVVVVPNPCVVGAGPSAVRHHAGPGDGEPVVGHLSTRCQTRHHVKLHRPEEGLRTGGQAAGRLP